MKAICIYVLSIAALYVCLSALLRWLAHRDLISNPFDLEEIE